jgi:hypothetical protein
MLSSVVLSALYMLDIRQAQAADADSYVRLVWLRGENAESCAGQAEVEQQVRARLGRDPFAINATRVIEAMVDYTEGVWHVDLSVREHSGVAQGRRVFDVRAQDCVQVVDAVGLAVALAIDPNANLQSARPQPAAPGPPTNANSGFGVEQPGAAANYPPTAFYWTPIPLYAPQQNSTCQTNTEYELTLRGLAAVGLLPEVAPGVAVSSAIGQQRIRFSVGLSYFPEVALDSRFSFGLSTVNAGLCGDLVKARSISAGLCGDLHAGAMHAVVRQLQPLHPGDRMFSALGLGPRLGWRAWAPFFVQGGVTVLVALMRPQFAIQGVDTPVFEPRPVSAVGFIGVGFVTL